MRTRLGRAPEDDDPHISSAIGGFVAAAGAIVAGGLLAVVRDSVSRADVALVLMVVVVVGAAIGGRSAGAVGAVVATLSFDYFHTQPYYSLRIGSREDIETALLLLAGGLVVGQLGARSRARGIAVEAGRSQLRRIHRLADLAATGAASTEVVDAAVAELTQLLTLRSCRFEAPPYRETFERMERSGVVLPPKQLITRSRMGRHGFELPQAGVELPVLSRGEEVGRFVLEPTPGVGASLEERVVAVALADQAGAAIGAVT